LALPTSTLHKMKTYMNFYFCRVGDKLSVF